MILPGHQGIGIQPFPVLYACHDYHVILFLDGHPEYEAAEAMISEHGGGRASIRAILTLLDKRQVDHLDGEAPSEVHTKREVHSTPMRYERFSVEGRTRIHLAFESFRGEAIRMELEAASLASPAEGALVDPRGHSGQLALPVMCPERVARLGPASRVHMAVAGASRAFRGTQGFYAENFRIGVLRASRSHLRMVQVPARLAPGEQWVYESSGGPRRYEILGVQDNAFHVRGGNEWIDAEVQEKGVSLRRVSFLSSNQHHKDSIYSLAFSPALPISPSMDGQERSSESRFRISIDERASLVTGEAASEQGVGRVKLTLLPGQPGWALHRKASISIVDADGGLQLETDILS
jgi:hypothetical protein